MFFEYFKTVVPIMNVSYNIINLCNRKYYIIGKKSIIKVLINFIYYNIKNITSKTKQERSKKQATTN